LALDEALAKINLLVQTRLSDESEPASASCRAGLILGRPQPQRWTMDDVLKHIRGLEAARFSAMKEGDLDELDAILDDNLIYVHSNGRIDSKAEYLETLRQGAIHYEAIEVKGDRYRIGKDSAVLVQSVIATMRVGVGRELITRDMVLMSVWRCNSTGRWTLGAVQSTVDTNDTRVA